MDWITALVAHDGALMIALSFGGVVLLVFVGFGGWGNRELPSFLRWVLAIIAVGFFALGTTGIFTIVVNAIRESAPVVAETQSTPNKDEDEKPLTGYAILVLIGGLVVWSIWDESRARKFELVLSDSPLDGKPVISIDVRNNEYSYAKCFAAIARISRDNMDIKREVTGHTNRLDWHGGSDEQWGVKELEGNGGFGIVIVAQVEGEQLRFTTAREPQPLLGQLGYYDLYIELRGVGKHEPKRPVHAHVKFLFDEKGIKLLH